MRCDSSRAVTEDMASLRGAAGAAPLTRPACLHQQSPALRQHRSACCYAAATASGVTLADAPSPLAPKPKPSASYQTTSECYAVVEVGGVQHLVEPNRWYTSNTLKGTDPGDVIQFGRVLLMKDEGQLYFGRPYLTGVTVEAEVLEHYKGEKVLVIKHKRKKHYKRKYGHRQPQTKCAPCLEFAHAPMRCSVQFGARRCLHAACR